MVFDGSEARMNERFYHPELDRLRFFAFFVVFIHHVFPQDPAAYDRLGFFLGKVAASCTLAGSLGVDLFFCLSSFLITTLLLREFDLRGGLDVRAFWVRRILRIWPLYFFFLGLTMLIVPLVLPKDHLDGLYLVAFVLLAGNWICVAEGYPPSVAAPLWSVSIEEQFYLIWPLLLSIVTRRRLVHLAVGCLVIATATRVLAVQWGVAHPGIWCNTFARLDPIAFGALFAVFNHNRSYSIPVSVRVALAVAGLALPPLLLFVLGKDCFNSASGILFYPLIALACVFVLAAVFKPGDGKDTNGSSRISTAFAYLGRISYGLYVFHALAIALALSWIPAVPTESISQGAIRFTVRSAAAIILTVVLAAVSYAFLEKPFLRLKKRFTYVQSTPGNEPSGRANELREAGVES